MLAVQAGACQAAVDCELVAPGVPDAEFRKWVSELHDLHTIAPTGSPLTDPLA